MINTLPRHRPAIRMNEFTQEKSYKCNHCGKCFSFSSILEAMNEYTRELNLKKSKSFEKSLWFSRSSTCERQEGDSHTEVSKCKYLLVCFGALSELNTCVEPVDLTRC